MSTQYIGLKIGSTNTTIYKSGNGLVLKEASIIAMPTNPKNKEIYALGNEALKIKDRLPQNIIAYSPITNGLIQYEDLTVLMLKNFIKKVFPNKTFGQNIKAIVCTPIGITPEEKKTFELTCFKAGIAEVFLVPDVICFAIGSGVDIQSEKASMIVDIGGNSTNIAIISNYSIIDGYNITIGGSLITSAIIKYISETYNLNINTKQAEILKSEICSLYENYNSSTEIEGFNPLTNSVETVKVTSDEFNPIIKHYYGKISDAINAIMKDCDNQISNDISEKSINFYGESSLITGLDKFMQKQTSFKANASTVSGLDMVGTGELIKYPQLLHKILKNL